MGLRIPSNRETCVTPYLSDQEVFSVLCILLFYYRLAIERFCISLVLWFKLFGNRTSILVSGTHPSRLTSSACVVRYHSVKSRRETLSSSSFGGRIPPTAFPACNPSAPGPPSNGRPPSFRDAYGYLISCGGPYESYPRRGDMDRRAPKPGT